jgi:hypothetical protein
MGFVVGLTVSDAFIKTVLGLRASQLFSDGQSVCHFSLFHTSTNDRARNEGLALATMLLAKFVNSDAQSE